MRPSVLVLALLVTAAAAQGQPGDPLKSAACAAALQRLQDAASAATPRKREDVGRINALRHEAAQACLGSSSGERGRSGTAYPAQAATPPLDALRRAVPPATTSAAPPPPLAIPRAPVITACDPAGCWDSDGHRLNNMGPVLIGPRGPCTVQGGIANCP
jgi:hypothetical protein